MKIASTKTITGINANNTERNQGLSPEGIDALDPEGTHVCYLSMVHNDDHLRTCWLLKTKGQVEPVHGMLDMSFEEYSGLTDAPEMKGQR